MRTVIVIIVTLACSQSQAWNWMQERVNTNVTCANGQCSPVVSPSNGSAVFRSIGSPSSGVQQVAGTLDCPDGRCRLVARPPLSGKSSQPVGNSGLCTPTLAPPEPKVIVQARPVRSVMVKPVKRLFNGRIFSRLRCR